MFIIEDESHAEYIAKFGTLQECIEELERYSKIPCSQGPNKAPCISWKTCGRRYVIIEYDDFDKKRPELRRIPALDVSSEGASWDPELPLK